MNPQKKLLPQILLFSVIVFSFYACSKSGKAPVTTDPSDQFVGTYSGTYQIYSGSTLDTTETITNYSITKSSANTINLLGEPDKPIGVVSGNTFTCNYSFTSSGTQYIVAITGSITNGVLTETGTVQINSGIVIYLTFSATYKKQ